jgi:hypothetical protein
MWLTGSGCCSHALRADFDHLLNHINSSMVSAAKSQWRAKQLVESILLVNTDQAW